MYMETSLSFCGRPEHSVHGDFVMTLSYCGRPEHSVHGDFVIILWEA